MPWQGCNAGPTLPGPVQLLTLFLTLDVAAGSAARLAQHPEWKQALAEEPLFRSFHFARTLPPPTRDSLPVAAAAAAATHGTSTSNGLGSMAAGLGMSLYQGVRTLSKKAYSSMSSAHSHEPTGDPNLDNVLSQVGCFSERAKKCATLQPLAS
jgi:hypothetical protein